MATNRNMNEAQIDLVAAYQKYTDTIGVKIRSTQRKIFNQMFNEIVNTSPKQSGNYKKGWAKKSKTHKDMGITLTVYNKSAPGLVHLLEFGHGFGSKSDKKWTPDPSKGQIPERISKIQAKYRRELDDEIENILKNT